MRRQNLPTAPSLPTGLFAALLLAGLVAMLAPSLQAQEPSAASQGVEVGPPVTPFSIDVDVRTLPAPAAWKAGDPVKFIPRREYAVPDAGPAQNQPYVEDPLLVLQRDAEELRQPTGFTTPILNIPGEPNTGVAPPDTVGDVGLNHYIQAVNAGGGTKIRIYDKAGNLIAGFTLDSLGAGSCANGLGDPIVLYDRQADRWMLSEFSSSGNYLCVFISKTGDPVTGGWWNYGFQCPSFPDYPKYGIWPTDAHGGGGSYIVTANDGGPGIYALDRGKMLNGEAATFQRKVAAPLSGFGFQGVYAPADVDGANAPPSGAPAIIATKHDTESNGAISPTPAGDALQLYEFQVDWMNPANSVLTGPIYPDIADFDATVCGLTTWDCIPQPGTSNKLDPLREPMMHRLQYWNHGTYESLVGNFTVDANGGDRAGLRWFEMRRTTGAWTAYAQGTYSPDSVYRWMGSAAADQSGNIALAYSVSDASAVYPGLRYTGRQFDDPAGQMTQSEVTIATGNGSQSFNRWGDYAAMGVDPADDCTFWFTSEYILGGSWRTQIAAFKFDRCGCLAVPPAPTVTASAPADNQVAVSWNDSTVANIAFYEVKRAGSAGGPFTTLATVADTSPGAGSGAGYAWTDTSVSGGSTYYYAVLADDGVSCVSPLSTPYAVTATGHCTLAPTFEGLSSASNGKSTDCGIVLTWSAGVSRCASSVLYSIYRSTTADFLPSPQNRVAAGVSGTSYTDQDGLVRGTVYYYAVRAWDASSGEEDTNLNRLGQIVTGPVTTTTPISENFNSASLPAGWSQMAIGTPLAANYPYWVTSATPPAGRTGQALMFKAMYDDGKSTDFQGRVYKTAGIAIPTTALQATLSYYLYNNTSMPHRDSAQVQISINGGSTWTDVGAPVLKNLGGASGWLQHTVNLMDYRGQTILVAIVGSSTGHSSGSNMYLDDLAVTIDDGGTCTTLQRPPEVSAGSTLGAALNWTSPTELVWQAVPGSVTAYDLQRGTAAGLPALLDSEGDSCLRATGSTLTATGLSDDPSGIPGRFYWYLVVAKNGVGTGPAGSGRVLDSTGDCTP